MNTYNARVQFAGHIISAVNLVKFLQYSNRNLKSSAEANASSPVTLFRFNEKIVDLKSWNKLNSAKFLTLPCPQNFQ